MLSAQDIGSTIENKICGLFYIKSTRIDNMSFSEDIPNYASLRSDEYEMQVVPSGFFSAFEGLVVRTAKHVPEDAADCLLGILSNFASIIPCSPPINWGFNNLIRNELQDISAQLRRSSDISKIMECLDVLMEFGLPYEEINSALRLHNIGYEYRAGEHGDGWFPRESNENLIQDLEETQASVRSISSQAEQQISAALDDLGNAENEMARKTIVWRLVCSMEAVVKMLGGANEIREATRLLNQAGIWGPSEIVKDGHSIFNRVQQLYPDLRHGSTSQSVMGEAEAYYWVGRLSCYMRYLAKLAVMNQRG